MYATSATTRARTLPVSGDRASPLLAAPQIVTSPETQIQCRVERLPGEGGVGQVYLATRLGHSALVPEVVCIKVSPRIDGWLRAAFVGQLLHGHPWASRVLDRVPLILCG